MQSFKQRPTSSQQLDWAGDDARYNGDRRVKIDHVSYQLFCASLWVDHADPKLEVPHCVLGLVGETGEVAELFKKSLRGDGPVDREKLIKELGDVAYYLNQLATLHDIQFEDVLWANVEKLQSRARRGVLRGSGDDR